MSNRFETTHFAELDFRLWKANILSAIRHDRAAFSRRKSLSAKQIDVPLPKDLPAVVDTQVVAELARTIVKQLQKRMSARRISFSRRVVRRTRSMPFARPVLLSFPFAPASMGPAME